MDQLLQIMCTLRENCPWDREQTPQRLTRYAIEEAYEVEAAVQSGDLKEIREELGDLLLQVVFQSQMYQEQGAFDFYDVVQTLTEKLIRRHPHVFDAASFNALTPEEVSHLWQQIKHKEKQGKPRSRLDETKPGPALNQSQAIQKTAAQLGFDFETPQDAFEKLKEELNEFEQAMQEQSPDHIFEEFGDCLFSLVNVGRKLGLSSEAALLATIHKFRQRFAYIEAQAQHQDKVLEDMTLQEMDQLWDQAKEYLKTVHT
ncbi:nucleoside triphosphate pyrophosphohydrolase [uncultured Acinetobacter sp.]|uniref:nucleoside triphosphate pyrophosphohydrolase n=1 Tax=uncultured Acinetobacter sp. TaxID=165433 RepID=UPI00258FC8ED|nr:nucleoside triphosphate pyrophosphohydrolase [uncultured Acinetobacter sp.]